MAVQDAGPDAGPIAACPRCGDPMDGHRFCEECGHDLWLRRGGAARAPGGPCPVCGANGVGGSGADGAGTAGVDPGVDPGVDVAGETYCGTCGRRRPDGTERVETDLGLVAGVSDRGLAHARNEDAMAVGVLAAPHSPALVAAAVCDGVSTVDLPDLASRAGADAALARLLHPSGPDMVEAVAEAAAAVGAVAGEFGRGDVRTAPSCTLVAAVVRPGAPESGAADVEITVGWVGDSRVYWLAAPDAPEPARLLTVDHSWAVEVVRAGLLDVDAALADPRAHAITRWLGSGSESEPEVVTLRPAGPGLLLLCTDGLWNYLPDPADLAGVALPAFATGGPSAAARALTALALDAGGRDNVTVVAVPVGL
jgi:PPM family protein phosphatase